MTDVMGILLAAGTAKRFGSAKLLHSLPNGVPMGVAAAQVLIQALPNTIVVVRPGDRVLQEAFLAAGLKVVENPRAAEGMGTSLAVGVKAASGADGWIIALADMPWIQPATVNRLADRLRNGASMVAPVYRGRRGHPVGFASCWGKKLKSLRGDKGARDLLTEYHEEIFLLKTSDPGVVEDIDYPDALKRKIAAQQN